MNAPVIKVITGMRRSGKSCLMKLVIAELTAQGVDAKQVLYINKESLEFDFINDYKDLYSFVKKGFKPVDPRWPL